MRRRRKEEEGVAAAATTTTAPSQHNNQKKNKKKTPPQFPPPPSPRMKPVSNNTSAVNCSACTFCSHQLSFHRLRRETAANFGTGVAPVGS